MIFWKYRYRWYWWSFYTFWFNFDWKTSLSYVRLLGLTITCKCSTNVVHHLMLNHQKYAIHGICLIFINNFYVCIIYHWKKKPLAKTLLTFIKSFDPSIFRLFKDQTKGVVIMSLHECRLWYGTCIWCFIFFHDYLNFVMTAFELYVTCICINVISIWYAPKMLCISFVYKAFQELLLFKS